MSSARGRQNVANQLRRGDRIMNYGDHHQGMAELKAQMGDPRPPGLELSLINYDGPSSYWGYAYKHRNRVPYRLSTNPRDYVWETGAENSARPETLAKARANLARLNADTEGNRLRALKGACTTNHIRKGNPCVCGQHVA